MNKPTDIRVSLEITSDSSIVDLPYADLLRIEEEADKAMRGIINVMMLVADGKAALFKEPHHVIIYRGILDAVAESALPQPYEYILLYTSKEKSHDNNE